MSVWDFPEFARNHWSSIRKELMEGNYKPSPVKRVEIPKPDGGRRPLEIPIVTDRVIQQAIAQVLSPVFDPVFSDSSYGFRANRSAHDAVRKVQEYIKQGYLHAVDIDLSKFFDMVNRDLLMQRLGCRIKDKTLLRLINSYLKAGVKIEGQIEPTPKGVPQGGPFSPLLSNIVLDELDKELEKRGHRFVWNDRSLAEFKRRVRFLTGRSRGVSMSYRLRKLAEYIRGWMDYYRLSAYYRPIPELDHWLRRRIRMCCGNSGDDAESE
jgi:RNA-directed DNA polymerase